MPEILHPFLPIWNANARVLILGSFPSVMSRANGFYYGNPRNRFWQVLEAIYGQPVPDSREGKTDYLLSHRLALWDVLAACEIDGSSDADIKKAVSNDLSQILDGANIARILANGRLTEKLFRRWYRGALEEKLFVLPSTSPANAAWSFDRLTDAWKQALIG